MAMTALERKVALILAGVKMKEIARQLGVSGVHVSLVVRGLRHSPRVQRAVADAIGKPVHEVFPVAEPAEPMAMAG
jgi:hypothetical protein